MNNERDILLDEFFNPKRLQYALDTAYEKGIDKSIIYALTYPENQIQLRRRFKNGDYAIAPTHQRYVEKDGCYIDKDGNHIGYRIVDIAEDFDRIFLSIVNDMLFDLMPQAKHKNCVSYLRGTGCGDVVIDVTKHIKKCTSNELGFKSDLSKYFDTCPRWLIDKAFDDVENVYGHSVIIDILREFYHMDLYFDPEDNLIQGYRSLKQGVAVSSYLADVVLYQMDEIMSNLGGYYVRYSDDCLYIGDNYEQAMDIMKQELAKCELKLNPNKVEYLYRDKWFKFLGFELRGNERTLSKKRIKTFQDEIKKRTIKTTNSYEQCLHDINNYLYRGNGEYSWCTQVLPVITSQHDIDMLNRFVMDCLKAQITNKKHLYGLGFVQTREDGVIPFATGKNVGSNNAKVKWLDGYMSINTYKKAPRVIKQTLISQLI